MIEVRVEAASVEVRGHGGLSLQEGDPVCAGVSALFWALVYGLREVAGAEADVAPIPDGQRVSWAAPLDEAGEAILRTVAGSLRITAERFPGQVKVLEVASHGA